MNKIHSFVLEKAPFPPFSPFSPLCFPCFSNNKITLFFANKLYSKSSNLYQLWFSVITSYAKCVFFIGVMKDLLRQLENFPDKSTSFLFICSHIDNMRTHSVRYSTLYSCRSHKAHTSHHRFFSIASKSSSFCRCLNA